MINNTIPAFEGVHCETTATGTLLNALDIQLSEPMLFGLGEGLSFIFWKMKGMEFPFIGGRVKTLGITQNLASNLNLELSIRETTSKKKAWQNIKQFLDEGFPVGLQLDCYYLDYFPKDIHFAGHFTAVYGYDEDKAYLVDTSPKNGRVVTSLESLSVARSAKGPMAAKSLSYVLERRGDVIDLKQCILKAARNNAKSFLNPPIKNIAYKGIAKTSKEISAWFKRSDNIAHEFSTTAMIMEKAGTGGSIFRNLYRDFLLEAFEETALPVFKRAYEDYREIALLWGAVAEQFNLVGETEDEKHIEEASKLLLDLSQLEFEAMSRLAKL